MKINKIDNMAFKGVYYVEADKQENKKNLKGLQEIDISSFSYNNNNTEKLYKILNPEYDKLNPHANKDLLLIRSGELSGIVSVDKPALILTNDENGKDATHYLWSWSDHNNEINRLKNKSEEALESMLKESDINIAKNPSIENIKHFPNQSYKDRLILAVENNLKVKFQKEEENLYEYLLKKVKPWSAKELKVFQTNVFNTFKNFVKNR